MSASIGNVLKEILQTEVKISRIDFGLPNRLILEDVWVKDQNDSTLLKASRLSAKIDPIPLFQGKVSISNVQLYGFNINLYQQNDTTPSNIRFLIDIFSPKEKKESNPNLSINTILIRRGKLSWHKLDRPQTPHLFNPNHILLDKINATLSLKQYTKDSLDFHLKKLSFEEVSGLTLKQLAFHLKADKKQALLDGFRLELPESHIEITPTLISYDYQIDANGKKSLKAPCFEGQISHGIFSLHDIASISPALQRMTQKKRIQPLQLDLYFKGNEQQIEINPLALKSKDDGLIARIPVNISFPYDTERRTLSADIRKIQISPSYTSLFAEAIQDEKGTIKSYLSSIGTIQANGNIILKNKQIKGGVHLNTDIGSLNLTAQKDALNKVKATLQSSNFDLGKLTGKPYLLGLVDLEVTGHGTFPFGGKPDGELSGIIHRFGYKQYEYQNIDFLVGHEKGTLNGTVSVDDPNLRFTAQGKANINSKKQSLKAEAAVKKLNLHRLHLTEGHEGKTFKGNVYADLRGSNIDNINGVVELNNFHMDFAKEDYTTGPIIFKASNQPDKRSLTLNSDFLGLKIDGNFKFNTLIANGKQMLHSFLPALIPATGRPIKAHDEITIDFYIHDTQAVEKVFDIPLQIEGPGMIEGYYNSATEDFDLNVELPAIDYNGQRFSQVKVVGSHENDSLMCTAKFNKNIGKAPVDFCFLTRAANDCLYAGLQWENHADKLHKGNIITNTLFAKDENNNTITDVKIHPTNVVINDSVWNIHESKVFVSPELVHVNQLKIEQGGRHLILDGDMSAHESDSLIADLKDIKVEYILNIINFRAVDFTGIATGRAYATGLLSSPSFNTHLNVQDFTFNRGYLGNMNVYGEWDKENKAIVLDAHITDPANKSMTHVDGEIRTGAPPKGGLDLMINTENIDMSFLNKYTKDIFTNLQGRASGWARVFGPFKGINLEGDMLVHHAGLKVNATEVDYRIVNDSVILRPDNIYFHNALIYDRYGNPGKSDHYAVVDGVLQHSTLSNMRYNFNVKARNILGYDVKDFGDNVFCGTAYATGDIAFQGKPGELNINIDATPEQGTVFTYNLSSPTTLTENQFITYKSVSKNTEELPDYHTIVHTPEPETDMRFNFNLNLTPNATMKILMDPKAGDYIALNGYGNIRANYYNKGRFNMYGTYTVDHGVYKLSLQDVIRKDFTFNSGGTIVFGGSPVEADLNLQAVYTVPSVSLNDLSARSTFNQNNVRVNCLMNLGGKAQAPQISFDFDIPNVNEDEKQMVRSLISTEEEKNMQVIYLLGIGRFYTYDYNNAEQSQSSVAMKSLLSTTLSGQLNQMFSTIMGNNSNWNIGTNLSTGEVGWSDMDVEGLLSGRLLNNRLLINGNFGYRENSATSTSNFIGDFDLQWLLTKNGNISLKAYSKTNDRYFTKSSLTTQGIGIGLKRDFNSWRDIFRLFVPKKKRATEEP